MAKMFDKITFVIATFIVSYIWLNYLGLSTPLNLATSFFVIVLSSGLLLHAKNRYQDKQTTTISEMQTIFAIWGAKKTICRLVSTLPQDYNVKIDGLNILIRSPIKRMYYIGYKFNPPNADDIAKARQVALKYNYEKIYILSRRPKREVFLMMNSLDIDCQYIENRVVHKYLRLHNALPEKLDTKKRKMPKVKFAEIAGNVFVRSRAKYFAFSGLILALMSFFTPLTLYYLILSSISLAATIVCLLQGKAY